MYPFVQKHFTFLHLFLLWLTWSILPIAEIQENDIEIAAEFSANRIFVHPVTENGDTLDLHVDTGGAHFFTMDLASQLRLPLEQHTINNRKVNVSSFPTFNPEASIPTVPLSKAYSDAPSVQGMYDLLNGRMFVYDFANKMKYYTKEGILGQEWFATRVWTFDYPNEKFFFHKSFDEKSIPIGHKTRIFFKQDLAGYHEMHFPRIQAVIDGDTLDFLLKTGATLLLKETVHQALDDSLPQVRGTSFITRGQFEEWHFEHPDWKIYEDVERNRSSNMIRVPEVAIAGHTVGPVWFTTRPDNMFHKQMSQFMDRKMDGAVGGSLLKYFRVTINYPKEYIILHTE